MAAGTPLTRLTLGAVSVADDLGYVALSDLAQAFGDLVLKSLATTVRSKDTDITDI